MAPSFTLFNHSFDSLGENYFNVDASLHNDSFGMIRTGSVAEAETGTQLLVNNLSNGNISTQLLVPSGSGHLTIGYSPVNSFGNISSAAPIRKQGSSIGNNASTMVLGPEIRPSSPSQVLGVYRSYSGGSPAARPGPLDDSHMRMSVGSFGAHSASYNRQFGEQVASQYYYGGPSRTQSFGEKVPPFYLFLRKYKAAFKNCTFLLPGLKAALLETPLSASTEDDDPMKSVDRGPVWGGPVSPRAFPMAASPCFTVSNFVVYRKNSGRANTSLLCRFTPIPLRKTPLLLAVELKVPCAHLVGIIRATA